MDELTRIRLEQIQRQANEHMEYLHKKSNRSWVWCLVVMVIATMLPVFAGIALAHVDVNAGKQPETETSKTLGFYEPVE